MDSTPADSTPPPEPPKIHVATLGSRVSGAVLKGAEIDLATAVARRQAGQNVVVCGDDLAANRALARTIESAVGVATTPQKPHFKSAGPLALPHFQQADKNHPGHTFYETANPKRKARKQP